MQDRLTIENEQEIEGKFISWDYAHYGDYEGYYEDKTIWEEKDFKGMKKWTTQEIFEEVKDACYQLKKLEEISPADKMFEELGFLKMNESDTEVFYETFGGNYEIVFYKNDKTFFKSCYKSASTITMPELKAINKKIEELGWEE